MSAKEFLDRVFERIPRPDPSGGLTSATWSHDKRPTSECVGVLPVSADIDSMVSCILNVEEYPRNVRYVDSTQLVERISELELRYTQRVSLPLLGGLQMGLALTDLGERDGYRVIAWEQDDELTMALDKKQGARTQYNLGAWILKPDAVVFAFSSAPVKSDVGSLKFAIMTRGGEVTLREVLKSNIEGMVAWSRR